LRVRYGECDAQGIVFNARWVDYVDVAVTEYTRALFGGVDPAKTGMDWRLAKQTLEWHAPGRYDDVLDIRIRTMRVGTTSFLVATELRRLGEDPLLVSAETVYVSIDPKSGTKKPVTPAQRAALEAGAPGVVVDHAGALR
jgi:acyl-CoA thioester hydrolase